MSDAVTVRLRVTWSTMMLAKVRSAARPSRLLSFTFTIAALGIGIAAMAQQPFLSTTAWVFGALVALRVAVMGLSAALDSGSRRYDNAELVLSNAGLALAFADGAQQTQPWSWVLSARRVTSGFALQVNERRGKMWLLLASTRHREALELLLTGQGKLR